MKGRAAGELEPVTLPQDEISQTPEATDQEKCGEFPSQLL